MPYTVRVISSARRELDRLSASIFRRLNNSILRLEQQPRPRGAAKLTGYELYRLRVGDFRIIYSIDDETREVTLIRVGHRREVYR